MPPIPATDLNIGQKYWWIPTITTVVFPYLQWWFSKYASSLEMPERADTRQYRQWFRFCNSVAGNDKRNDRLDQLIEEWRAH